jgi:hypothetical protein
MAGSEHVGISADQTGYGEVEVQHPERSTSIERVEEAADELREKRSSDPRVGQEDSSDS